MTSKNEPSLLEDFLSEVRQELADVNFPTLGELATAFLAAATAVVGMGAAVVWIRAGNAGLPQLQTLTLVPQQQFVLLGARELALPMIFWSALNLVLFPLGRAKGRRRARLKPPSKWGPDLVVGVPRGIGIAALFFYPLNWATVTFATVLLFYSVLAEHPRLMNLKVAVGMGACVSFCAGLADEADAPNRLDKAVVMSVAGETTAGYYISSTPQAVYLGQDGAIRGIPSRRVVQMKITHPPEGEKDKPPSIADRALDAVGSLF